MHPTLDRCFLRTLRVAGLAALVAISGCATAPVAASAAKPAAGPTALAAPELAPAASAALRERRIWAHEASELKPDPAVTYGQLPNGLRYALMRNALPSKTAAVRMRFGVGSMMEADDQRGLAHFLEHMVFNGSQNIPEGEMVKLLERLGLQRRRPARSPRGLRCGPACPLRTRGL